MTVCIAAICDKNKVVGASDRMITAGDVQFEPEQPKIWTLTTSIVALYSGDTAVVTEILRNVEIEINSRIAASPTEWVKVREIANIYRGCYWDLHVKRAENKILAPLGLTAKSFLEAQGGMDADVVQDLTDQMQDFALSDSIEVIFAGLDTEGPQNKQNVVPSAA